MCNVMMWSDLSFLLQNDDVGEQRDFRLPHLRAPGAVQCVLAAQVRQHHRAQEKHGKMVVMVGVSVERRKKTTTTTTQNLLVTCHVPKTDDAIFIH